MNLAVIKHALIVAAYLLLAIAVVLVGPALFPGTDPVVAGGAGALVFLAGLLAHEIFVRFEQQASASAEMAALRHEIEAVRGQTGTLGGDLQQLESEVEVIAARDDGQARKDLDRVVAEVRVLQNLIERLSGAGAASTGPEPEPEAAAVPPQGEDDQYDEGQILDIVRDALRRDRVDLYLQPIVGLPQRKTRFFECFSRVRAPNGSLIRPDRYLDIAKQEGLVGAIDNMLLFRCVQLVRRAQTRNHNVGFFCNISGNTLGDRSFFADFVDFLAANRELSGNMIFEFSQADIRAYGPEIENYVERLGRLGFHFSLDRVEDLSGLDFAALARRRFKYVKIDAANLVERPASEPLPLAATAQSGPAENETRSQGENGTAATDREQVVGVNVGMLKRAMDVNGIELIVEKIESEQDLIELLDYRIDFGQGYLFGEPRISREA